MNKIIGTLKEFGKTMVRGNVYEIPLTEANDEQKKEIRAMMEHALSGRGYMQEKTEWESIKEKQKEKHLNKAIYIEEFYNTLKMYEGEKRDIIAREMWYFGHDSLLKLKIFSDLFAEEQVHKVCTNNPEHFMRNIINIFDNEFTEYMRFNYIDAPANQRVAYVAAVAIGDRSGSEAETRLSTINRLLDGTGRGTKPFALMDGGNFADIIDQAKVLLYALINEDEAQRQSRLKRE